MRTESLFSSFRNGCSANFGNRVQVDRNLHAYELTEKLESVKLDECIQEIRANAARAAAGSENRSKAQRIASIQAFSASLSR